MEVVWKKTQILLARQLKSENSLQFFPRFQQDPTKLATGSPIEIIDDSDVPMVELTSGASSPNTDDDFTVLERNETIYVDETAHKAAVDGFARLFENSLMHMEHNNFREPEAMSTELGVNGSRTSAKEAYPAKRRIKQKRQHSSDDDNISPISGTIIRRLRDDEELVVRKGDIDPAFNVVEITTRPNKC